jgi:two-component system CheB/CheR fusion protein
LELPVRKTSRSQNKKRREGKQAASFAPGSLPQTQGDLFPVVGIGASAGGLEAFKELLSGLPDKAGMAYVLIPHLDPSHHSVLTQILSGFTKMSLVEVTDGMAVEPDHIYVIPPNKSMGLIDGKFALVARKATTRPHMPIDYFLTSLAIERRERSVGIILSGTASDGTQGCIAIKVAGGVTFAQDEKSAKYFDMPWNAVQGGSVDFVLPPREIARALARIGRRLRAVPEKEALTELGLATHPSELDPLFALLHKSLGVDFRHYKQSTVQRRIRRRMVLHNVLKLKDYVRLIRDDSAELEALYQDLLIHVTEFFREGGAFEALRNKILPAIMQDEARDGALRIWVPGCSTGQEVYSLAMVILEFLWNSDQKSKRQRPHPGVQIFATDISDTALERARSGVYSVNELQGVSKQRLKRFFLRHDGAYRIQKPVREMCVFAKQNVVRDPPFSNLDLISCRNVLIYFGHVLQKRTIPAFYYALKPRGYLMLGPSESLGSFDELFGLVDKKHKIYQKKRSTSRLATHFIGPEHPLPGPKQGNAAESFKELDEELDSDRGIEKTLAGRFVPPSIVVNEHMEIVQFRGKVGPYLEPASGHPTFSLFKMIREDLQVDIREAVSRAKKDKRAIRNTGIPVRFNAGVRDLDLEVIPVNSHSARGRLYIIAFQHSPRHEPVQHSQKRRSNSQKENGRDSRELLRTQQELERLREQLHTTIEEHESTLEEFKSANAEILSANEELQSTNEELETTKEELQSSNEELSTLNEELQVRNTELTVANNDQLNLMNNVNLPVVMVGNDLRIRRLTPPAEKMLNLRPGDVGRRLGEIRTGIEPDDLERFARTSVDDGVYQEREVRVKSSGWWYLLRVRPYKTWEGKIDGAVLSFTDIDALKRDHTRVFSEALIENVRDPVLVLSEDLHVTMANPAFYRSFQVTAAETVHHLIYELGKRQWDIRELHDLFHKLTTRNARIEDFEVRHKFPHLGARHMILNARRIEPHGASQAILLTIQDLSAEKTQK